MSYINDILKMSQLGLVFPLTKENTPAFRGWQDWATQDATKIHRHWKNHPDDHVGMLTGSKSNLTVIDLDVKNGKDGVSRLKSLSGNVKLKNCERQKTKSGGYHLFFKFLSGSRNATNILSECELNPSGIDVRSEGGYVTCWPTPGYKYSEGRRGDVWKFLMPHFKERKSIKTLDSKTKAPVIYDEKKLRSLLFELEVEEYRDRSAWLNVMAMVSSGSGGAEWGRTLFIEWSKQDEAEFTSDPELYIKRTWVTLKPDKPDGLTAASLSHQARKNVKPRKFKAADMEEEAVITEVTTEHAHEITAAHESTELDVWQREVKKTKFGVDYVLTPNITNMINFLTQPKLPEETGDGTNPLYRLIVLNELKEGVVYSRSPPWAHSGLTYADQDIGKADFVELQSFMQMKYKLRFSAQNVEAAISAASSRVRVHPVRNYIDRLAWDGQPRLEEWLIKSTGVKDTPYLRGISRCFLLAAVARVYFPGCRADNVLVLEGEQGVGKSGLVEVLGGPWFANPVISIGSIDAEQNIQGKWIIEWAEMASRTAKEAESVKAYLTSKVARFRGSYGTSARDWPRRSIFVITVNPRDDVSWLNDPTGGRRFWPVRLPQKGQVEKVNFKWLEENRDQLFAEAHSIIAAATPHDLTSARLWTLSNEQEKEAVKQQALRNHSDAIRGLVREALEAGGELETFDAVTAVQVTEVLFGRKQITEQKIVSRVARCLASLGWVGRSENGCRSFLRPLE